MRETTEAVKLTWDLQLVVEGVGFEAAQPGRVFLQVARFLLESTHVHRQLIHLLQKVFVFPLLKQFGASSSQEFLHLFREFLEGKEVKWQDLLTSSAVNSRSGKNKNTDLDKFPAIRPVTGSFQIPERGVHLLVHVAHALPVEARLLQLTLHAVPPVLCVEPDT